MTEETMEEAGACFLSRHPVFDRTKKVHAYEVAARSALSSEDPSHVDVDAFSWMVSDGVGELQLLLEDSERLMIFVPDPMLDAPEVHLLPMDYCELVVTPGESDRENLEELLAFYQDYGYSLALRFVGSCQEWGHLIKYAATVILDLGTLTPMELAKERKFLKAFKVRAMLDHVDAWESFAGAKALGFELFQGAFFGRPEVVKGRKLSANALTRMELMGKLLDENSTFKDMAAIIAKDPLLSYRLLKYVNSPGVGLGRTVTSIEHAVAILGDNAFKHWAMMALVASLETPRPRARSWPTSPCTAPASWRRWRAGSRPPPCPPSPCSCWACSRSWTPCWASPWPSWWPPCPWTRASRPPCAARRTRWPPGWSWCGAWTRTAGATWA